MQGHAKNKSSKGGNKQRRPPPPTVTVRDFARHDGPGRPETDTRVMTYTSSIAATTGNIAGGSYASGLVYSSTEYSQMAARYQELRVKAMRIRIYSAFQKLSEAAPGVSLGPLLASSFVQGVAPAPSVSAILASDDVRIDNKVVPNVDMLATWDLNPNAKLWSSSPGAMAAANQFGVQFRFWNACPAALTGLTQAFVVVEFLTEFRVAQ